MGRDKVFISYSHKDGKWLEALRTHLKPLEAQGKLDVWVDAKSLSTGDLWLEGIRSGLSQARVGVLLVSPDFLASDFIAREEVPELLVGAKRDGARIVCVYVRPSMVDEREFAYADPVTGERKTLRLTDFQGANSPDKPLSKLSANAREEQLVAIAKDILRLAGAKDMSEPKPSAPVTGRAPVDPKLYLEKLREDHRYLDIRGMGAKTAERMELQAVYTRLRVTGPAEEREPARSKRSKKHDAPDDEMREALGAAHARGRELSEILAAHRNLVLIGDPGSGKTTFLRFVALNLAQALLGEDRHASMQRVGLEGEPRFPVYARLSELGEFLGKDAPPQPLADDSPEHLYRFLDHWLRSFPLDLPESYLSGRVREGNCLLLLDGFDEVAGTETRKRVGCIVEQVMRGGTRNRHVITARTKAYEGKAQLQGEYARANLVDFGDEEVALFVEQWCRALHRVEPGEDATAAAHAAESYRQELLAAIRAHPSVAPLTRNPLMLTVLAVVHWSQRKLPEQRAELYEAAVNCLLESRAKLSPIPHPTRKECLQAVAVRMFEDPAGVRRTLDRAEAAEPVREILNISRGQALAFLEDEELHSGILVSRVEGEVEFWHLTFQEYLAALALSGRDEYWASIQPHLHDDRWREVVLLLAGYRRRQGTQQAKSLIERILKEGTGLPAAAKAVALVGRILRDILPYGTDPSVGTRYDAALHEVLSIFARGGPDVPEPTRIEVGEALGAAGDPRLDDDVRNRVHIPGGQFQMGAQKKDNGAPGYDEQAFDREEPVHRVTLSELWIDRYQVTVQQFKTFVDGGGYDEREVWADDGWTWRTESKRRQPGGWKEQLQHLNRPVVNVTWYEADAFATWSGASLPTEAQWEYAARGSEGRKWPWGNEEPTDRHANFGMRVGRPTPVGIYPLGSTPEGVRDMAGNVWEWCADWRAPYEPGDATDPTGPPTGVGRVLRGGSFNDDPTDFRGACRGGANPVGEGGVIGFRRAWSSPAGRGLALGTRAGRGSGSR